MPSTRHGAGKGGCVCHKNLPKPRAGQRVPTGHGPPREAVPAAQSCPAPSHRSVLALAWGGLQGLGAAGSIMWQPCLGRIQLKRDVPSPQQEHPTAPASKRWSCLAPQAEPSRGLQRCPPAPIPVLGQAGAALPETASGSVPPAEATEQFPPQQRVTCTCGIKHLCVRLGKGPRADDGGRQQPGRTYRARDHKTSLGRKMGSLTPDLRGQAQLEKGSKKGPQFCPRVSPEPGKQVRDSRTPWHHCFLCTTWRRCSSLSAATMGCSFCRWWLMRWLMLSNSTSLVLTWGRGTVVLNSGELPLTQHPVATPRACPRLCPPSPTPHPAPTPVSVAHPRPCPQPRALPSPLPRDPPAAGAWAARCACRSARTAPGW